jgi:Ca2+-binding RTX toxin-like protein
MLMLAGMMGLMAIGGIAFAGDMLGDEESDYDDPDQNQNSHLDPMPPIVPVNQILPGDGLDNDMVGGEGNDQINGYSGDDVISGGGGNDVLHGGEGGDVVSGDAGNDILHGEYGNDSLSGGAGDDQIFGHGDNDTLSGGDGNDELQGGQGNDTLTGGAGDDALHGGDGDDHLQGGDGQDTLFGGWGNDWLSGLESGPADPDTPDDANTDFLNGGGGDDTIIAGAGDIVTGSDGADTIVLGDWIIGEEAAVLMDFDTAEDALVIVADMDQQSADPVIEIVFDPAAPDVNHILVDGTEIATVYSDSPLTGDDILLVDYAEASALGLSD